MYVVVAHCAVRARGYLMAIMRGGVLGVLKHPPIPLQIYSTPVQSFARHWQSCSSVSLDNLCVMVMVEEGRMEARVVAKRLGDGP